MNASKIIFTESQYNFVCRHMGEYAKDGLEDGYSFLVVIHDNGVYEIKKVITFERNVERSNVSFSTDPKAIEKSIAENPKLHYGGDGHMHPWHTVPRPSQTDINQLKESKKERPWTVMGIHSLDGVKFFGMKEERIVDIPHVIVPDSFSEDNILARISKLTNNEILRKKKVAIIGCGSLASGMIQPLACSGVRKFVVADMDSFSDVNVIRHLGNVYDVGRDKVDIFKEFIECKNPLANVVTVKDDLMKNRELPKYIIEWSDLVIASSGNPDLNYQINIQCVEMKKPVVFGGIYERAESAYVSYYDPNEKKACFDCIFGLTSSAIDNSTIARNYGMQDAELKEAQGHFKDIMIPGAMMSSFAIDLMMNKKPECNLVRYYSKLKVERFVVPQKKNCATCDYKSWLQREEEKLEPQSAVEKIIRSFKFFFRKVLEVRKKFV